MDTVQGDKNWSLHHVCHEHYGLKDLFYVLMLNVLYSQAFLQLHCVHHVGVCVSQKQID